MPAADSTVRIDGPALPPQAWALAWSSLAAQVLVLVERGFTQADGLLVLLSMAVGAVVFAWVSAGVLTGRTGRLVVAWLFLGTSLVAYLIGALDAFDDSGWDVIHLGVTAIQIVALASFCRTSYFQRLRATARPTAPLGSILVIAVAAGAIGGVIAPQDEPFQRGPGYHCGAHGHHAVHCRNFG